MVPNSKGSFTPNDSVNVTVDGQNGYATYSARHSARQISKVPPVNGDGVVRCEQTLIRSICLGTSPHVVHEQLITIVVRFNLE